MDAACAHYDVAAIASAEVRCVGGHFAVDVGDGAARLPFDAGLACLCRRIYASVMGLSPRTVYMYASGDELELMADGEPFPRGGSSLQPRVLQGGDADDIRLREATLQDVSVTLVQAFASCSEASTFGYAVETLRFPTEVRARLALAVDRHHRLASARDVLRCVARALCAPLTRRGVLSEPCLPELRATPVVPRDADASYASGEWTRVCSAVRGATAGTALHLWADECGRVVRVLVVCNHWRSAAARPEELEHLRTAATITFAPLACGAGKLVLRREAGVEQWWACEDAVYAPLPMPAAAVLAHSALPLPAAMDADGVLGKRQREIVNEWSRSHRAMRSTAPRIGQPLAMRELVFLKGDFVVRRDRELPSDDGVRWVLEGTFPKEYVAERVACVERAREDAGCFVAHDADEAALAAAIFWCYACQLGDGEEVVVLLIDSFAVAKGHQGAGVGGTFYSMLCDAVARAFVRRVVVMAQCLHTKSAQRFWQNRLDPSTLARALFYQVHCRTPERLLVCSDCTARARFHEDVGEDATGRVGP